MSNVTGLTITRTLRGEWQFAWSGTPTWRIYLDGELIAGPLSTPFFQFNGPGYVGNTPPPLEIWEGSAEPQSEQNPAFFTLQWRGIPTAAAYVIEQFQGGSGGSWVEIDHLFEVGSGYYTWQEVGLADDTVHLFRVIALSQGGQEGTPVEFSALMVRNPAPPDVVCTINSAGDVVVSAA